MFGFIKKIFGSKPAEVAPVVDTKVEAANSAPYKVEVSAPAVTLEPVAATPAKKPAAKKQQFAKKAPAAKKPATARKPKAKPTA